MHEIKVSADSWHYALYRWWALNSPWYRKHGSTYRENLCHYVRVILFWAPLLWFFSKGSITLSKQKDITIVPWQLTFIVSCIIGEIALIFLAPPLGWAILITIALIVVVLAVGVFIAFLHEEYTKQFEKVIAVIFFPIWAPIWVVMKLHDMWQDLWYARVYLPLVNRNLRWLTYIVNGWAIALLIGLILFRTLLDWSVQWEIIKLVALLAAIVVIAFIVIAIAVGAAMVTKRLWYRYVTLPRRLARQQARQNGDEDLPKPERGPGMARLTWIYVKEAKLGSFLCPLMKLPETARDIRYGGIY